MLQTLDTSQSGRPQNESWRRFFPPVTLLLGPKEPARAERYLLSWVRILPAWKYLLDSAEARITALTTQWWRDILSGPELYIRDSATRTAQRAQLIRTQFGHLFRDEDWNERGGRVDWQGHVLRKVTDDYIDHVVWELTELTFRYELLALDRVLVPRRLEPGYEVEREELLARVFQDKNARAPDRIPAGGVGLAHPITWRRVNQLEALRRVIYRWPLSGKNPPSVEITRTMPELDVLAVERELITIYVKTFFATAGRPPCIPHIAPAVSLYASEEEEVDGEEDESWYFD